MALGVDPRLVTSSHFPADTAGRAWEYAHASNRGSFDLDVGLRMSRSEPHRAGTTPAPNQASFRRRPLTSRPIAPMSFRITWKTTGRALEVARIILPRERIPVGGYRAW